MDPVSSGVAVDFSITVPAYQSNELQVGISWGETAFNADWVGDELWSAVGNFPAETQNLLRITFYDNNGGIVLGRFEQLFRTGNQAGETVSLSADEFDVVSWDDDLDGVSNLDELIGGTDPGVDDTAELEVRDSVSVSSTLFLAEYFSRRLPAERPYTVSRSEVPTITETGPPWGGPTLSVDIAIDENGNGTFNDFYQYRPLDTSEQLATRTVTASSVAWVGAWNAEISWEDTNRTLQSFNTVVTATDASQRTYSGDVSWSNQIFAARTSRTSRDFEFNLTGNLVDGTSLCLPVEGSIVQNVSYNSGDPDFPNRSARTTISRGSSDRYWKVTEVDLETGEMTSEYYAIALNTAIGRDPELMGGQDSGQWTLSYPAGQERLGRFKCNFVDW